MRYFYDIAGPADSSSNDMLIARAEHVAADR
jgi:hypothetical protein